MRALKRRALGHPFSTFVPFVCFVVSVGIAGCAKSPVSPGGSITVTAAAPLSPANGASIAYAAQPVRLAVANATSTDPNAFIGYTFDVATDAGFANKVITKTTPQGAGQTAITLDLLPGGATYYWRVRATADDTVGAFTSSFTFTIGPAVVIDAPVAVAPVPGSKVSTNRPTLTVTNATRTGPAGTIVYRFEIATDAAFTKIVVSSTVTETTTTTSFTPATALGFSTTHYWRARATDTSSNISGSYSVTATFITPGNPNEME